jgi:putative membrane protein
MWYGHMDGDWSWWMLIGWTWMAVFWGLVVWGAVVLFQRTGRGQAPSPEDDPLTILERRYARGELGGQEFEEMRRTMRGR